MTREEEIKAMVDSHSIAYYHPLEGYSDAEPDMRYLLARNEELQRRVDHLEMALGAIKEEAATFASDERDLGYIFIGIYTLAANVLDAKEHDDATQSPELVPVYPGPDLKRGDVVYTPNGTRAEVYNISEDAGTFTSQGQFCASVLRREKKEQEDETV